MRKFTYTSSLGSSVIFFGNLEACWPRVEGAREAPLITSRRIASLYPHLLQGRAHLILSDEEEIKSFEQVKELYYKFLVWGLDRSSLIVGLGGGAITDLVGFAASTYMRGMAFVFIPTTLLAQVDAAIGGKTGIDFAGLKNIIGTFALPRATFIDHRFLLTLPEEEILNGLAEVVKHGLIASPELFFFLEKSWTRLLHRDLEALKRVVFDSVRIKIAFIREDARESGSRRILNFGHTFAHALEKIRGISHGQAVVWGMALATRLSAQLGLLACSEARHILHFLHHSFPFLRTMTFPWSLQEQVLAKVRADKKKTGEEINFVFLREIGRAEVKRLPLEELERLIHDLCQSGEHFS